MPTDKSVLALRWFELRIFGWTNFYNEARALRFARHPKYSEKNRTRPNRLSQEKNGEGKKNVYFPTAVYRTYFFNPFLVFIAYVIM